MFPTLTEKLIVGVLALVVIVGSVAWLEHRGAQGCEAADATAVASRIIANSETQAAGTIASAKEDDHRAQALARPIAAVPQLNLLQPAADSASLGSVPATGSLAGARACDTNVGSSSASGSLRTAQDAAFVAGLNRFIVQHVQRGRTDDVEVADSNRLLVIRDAVCRGEKPPGTGLPEP
jgi:hypothetical protein